MVILYFYFIFLRLQSRDFWLRLINFPISTMFILTVISKSSFQEDAKSLMKTIFYYILTNGLEVDWAHMGIINHSLLLGHSAHLILTHTHNLEKCIYY